MTGQPGKLTWLDLLLLLNEVRCKMHKEDQRHFARDWFVGLPKSEATAPDVLRGLAERFFMRTRTGRNGARFARFSPRLRVRPSGRMGTM
jgi:hypothetical protein